MESNPGRWDLSRTLYPQDYHYHVVASAFRKSKPFNWERISRQSINVKRQKLIRFDCKKVFLDVRLASQLAEIIARQK